MYNVYQFPIISKIQKSPLGIDFVLNINSATTIQARFFIHDENFYIVYSGVCKRLYETDRVIENLYFAMTKTHIVVKQEVV